MIISDYARTMARYNRWQNGSLIKAASSLSDADRRATRGAFFGSIHGTFSHLMWADQIWFSRFTGSPKPPGGIKDSATLFPDWEPFIELRHAFDATIIAWADGLTADQLAGDLTWFSGAVGRELTKPFGLLVAHVFNHQTHHRGQIHAMLTAAGAKPDDTDLMIMPDEL
jgi:uncharacterized damage-inducible protein DinB